MANSWQLIGKPFKNKKTPSKHMANTGQGNGKAMANQRQNVANTKNTSQTPAKRRAGEWQMHGKSMANHGKHTKQQQTHATAGQRIAKRMANQCLTVAKTRQN